MPDRDGSARNSASLASHARGDGHERPALLCDACVKRGKSELDAEAICEAVRLPTMRFVPVTTVEQQGILVIHRARALLVRQRTMVAHALRAHWQNLVLWPIPALSNLAKSQQPLSDANGLGLCTHFAGYSEPADHGVYG